NFLFICVQKNKNRSRTSVSDARNRKGRRCTRADGHSSSHRCHGKRSTHFPCLRWFVHSFRVNVIDKILQTTTVCGCGSYFPILISNIRLLYHCSSLQMRRSRNFTLPFTEYSSSWVRFFFLSLCSCS